MISSPWRPGIALATQVLEFCKVLDFFYRVLEFHKNPRFGKSLNPDLGVLEGEKLDLSLSNGCHGRLTGNFFGSRTPPLRRRQLWGWLGLGRGFARPTLDFETGLAFAPQQ